MFEPTKKSIAATVSRELLHQAASEYLSSGWSVVPLSGKLPLCAWKEYQTRSATPHEVASWFVSDKRSPTGIAIVTGKLSGVLVVDCDSAEDAAFWQAAFPASPMVVSTGGGGVHFYYRLPETEEVRNRTRVLGRKIDIRGEGGYAAAPPSLHDSGRRYEWMMRNPELELPAFSPDWIVDKDRPACFSLGGQGAEVRNAVAYIRRIHAVSGEGGHNATYRAACKLRDAGLAEEEAMVVLSEWNESNATPPWSAQELEHKIRSAFDSQSR